MGLKEVASAWQKVWLKKVASTTRNVSLEEVEGEVEGGGERARRKAEEMALIARVTLHSLSPTLRIVCVAALS